MDAALNGLLTPANEIARHFRSPGSQIYNPLAGPLHTSDHKSNPFFGPHGLQHMCRQVRITRPHNQIPPAGNTNALFL